MIESDDDVRDLITDAESYSCLSPGTGTLHTFKPGSTHTICELPPRTIDNTDQFADLAQRQRDEWFRQHCSSEQRAWYEQHGRC